VLRWLRWEVGWRRLLWRCWAAEPVVDVGSGASRPKAHTLVRVAGLAVRGVGLLRAPVAPRKANGVHLAPRPTPWPGSGWEAHVARRAL
jgi:hypothetical protein